MLIINKNLRHAKETKRGFNAKDENFVESTNQSNIAKSKPVRPRDESELYSNQSFEKVRAQSLHCKEHC